MRCILPESFGGRANLYADFPIHLRISKGPIYLGLSLPFLPNLITPLTSATFKNTLSPVSNSSGRRLLPTYFCCRSWETLNLSLIFLMASLAWSTSSGPRYLRSGKDHEYMIERKKPFSICVLHYCGRYMIFLPTEIFLAGVQKDTWHVQCVMKIFVPVRLQVNWDILVIDGILLTHIHFGETNSLMASLKEGFL